MRSTSILDAVTLWQNVIPTNVVDNIRDALVGLSDNDIITGRRESGDELKTL